VQVTVERDGRREQGYTGAGKAWIEEHLGWSVEVVKHPPKEREASGDRTAISMISLPCGLNGFDFHLSRGGIVAPYQGAG